MFELLINPKKAEIRPWQLFFAGLFYATLSVLLVNWMFLKDSVLSNHAGVLIVTFTVMFSMPFMISTIKFEEQKITDRRTTLSLIKEHEKAIYAFMWLFLGFVVAFSFWNIVLPSTQSFHVQIETYCSINQFTHFNQCVEAYSKSGVNPPFTSSAIGKEDFFPILTNNLYVLLFTLIFSLIFGAGVIFILAWNATVIAAAVGIFTQYSLKSIHFGFLRFMIHGIPEISAYFVMALAGGMVSVAALSKNQKGPRLPEVLRDSFILSAIAVGILFLAALIEVFVTPVLF
jgi:uncharacterized membrane protein SpoIIM required for sporulation